jgi:hypothetical protein
MYVRPAADTRIERELIAVRAGELIVTPSPILTRV